jgi:hypothetical protein
MGQVVMQQAMMLHHTQAVAVPGHIPLVVVVQAGLV